MLRGPSARGITGEGPKDRPSLAQANGLGVLGVLGEGPKDRPSLAQANGLGVLRHPREEAVALWGGRSSDFGRFGTTLAAEFV